MDLGSGLGHLTYCTNIHAAESWADTMASLERHLPAIKAELAPDRPFGVGLRLSAIAAEALAEGDRLQAFRAWLERAGCYVFTINGFPYGPFHGQRVKEQVYQPDWTYPERLAYSNRLADLLAVLLPDQPGLEGSVSTVPGTFKPLAAEPGVVARIADNLLRHVAHLAALRARTGRIISLALEPEPYCLLETIDETVAFFRDHLQTPAAQQRLAELAGVPVEASAALLQRHLGVCYDVCHAAVEYEDPAASLAALGAAGIRITKLQLSAALRVPRIGPDAAAQLKPFNEPVYLHQVIERDGDRLIRHLDLPAALATVDQAAGREWRVHFHVPIFLAELEHFSTTQDFLRQILALHRAQPISAHLEVETYTWDVLPERYRGLGVASAIARELAWVRQELA